MTNVSGVAPRPFEVTWPCASCGGTGRIGGGVEACADCRATGVARFLHGTRVQRAPGELIEPGHAANFGEGPRTANHVYFTGTLDAATWGAELARGEGRGRIYVVEPTGPFEDDPNLTDKKFPGNPTRSFRSRAPLRVVGELEAWQGHAPEQVQAMRDGLAALERAGRNVIDD